MEPEPHWVRGLAARIGFRGLGLTSFAAVCFAYGSGILLGYRPTFSSALGITIAAYAWGFIGVGAFALTGILASKDRWHYSICALWVSAWVFLIITHWTQPYGWAASVSWMGVAGALVIASAWPEPPHRATSPELAEPDLTDLTELTQQLADLAHPPEPPS